MLLKQDPVYARKMMLANSMIKSGADGSPVTHPMQALGRIAQSFAGHKLAKDQQEESEAKQSGALEKLTQAMTGQEWLNPDTGQVQKYKPDMNYLAKVLIGNPDTMSAGVSLAVENAKPKERKVLKDARGVNRYQDTGELLFGDMSEYDPHVISDAAEKQKQRIAAAGKSTTKIESNTPVYVNSADDKYFENRGKGEATAFEEAKTAAESARQQNLALESFIQNAAKGHAGGAAQLLGGVENFLSSFGYSSESLQSTQMMQQAVGQILAAKMSELGARGLTDKDMEILRDSLPRLETDPNARIAIARVMQKANNATIGRFMERVKHEDQTYPGHKFYRPAWTQDWRPAQGPAGQPVTGNEQPAAPQSDEEYNALPSGALFIDPDDGKVYRKP